MKTWAWLKMVLSGAVGAAIVLVGVWYASHRMKASTTDEGTPEPQVTIHVGPATPVNSVNPSGEDSQAERKVYDAVQQMLQAPPNNLDASGFVQSVMAEAGISVPRTVEEQAQTGSVVDNPADLRIGDLVFFDLEGTGSSATFDGVYIGQNQFAAMTTHGLRVVSLSDAYWSDKYLYGRRVM
ncbi:C40 family peptidase [Alicyclobacillus shizuokensis]|uniref:C40 family peptidase n=1 Tax=Alicyclobacillus shizuokensis TaxID=392014 RepID=UPI00083734D1|nr:C40 family peptidase [Alicyclobacillus shizuokensis]MCL6625176.1 C40 family peptidase [Alicyclobacillus shizuokensis]